MLELLLFIAVIIIVVVAIKLGKQDNVPAARPSGLPDGLKMARRRAVESGDTEAVQAIDNGTYKELLEQLRKRGYTQVRLDGEITELNEVTSL